MKINCFVYQSNINNKYLNNGYNTAFKSAAAKGGKVDVPVSKYKSSKRLCYFTENDILSSKTDTTLKKSSSCVNVPVEFDFYCKTNAFILEMYNFIRKSDNENLQVLFKKFMEAYQKGEIGVSELADKFSELKIKSLLCDLCEEDDIDYEYNQIKQILSKGDVTSSNLEMLMNLVSERKIHPAVIQSFTKDGRLNQNAEKDLEKLYASYINGKNPKEEFIPYFYDEEEAVETIGTGDLCTINGSDNIQIKMSDNTLKELFISADTYFELFPPVERYIYTQGNNGDCYFISVIDSIYSNPNTRYRILECFNENKDGSIDMSPEGFQRINGKIYKKQPDSFVLYNADSFKDKEFKQNASNLSCTCEGLKLLEFLYEKNNENAAYKRIMEYYKKLIKAEDLFMYIDKGTVNIDDKGEITKEEVDIFLSLIQKYIDKPEEINQRFISLEDTSSSFKMSGEELLSALYSIDLFEKAEKDDEFLKKCSKEQIQLLKLILERNLKKFKNKQNKYEPFKEILPVECYEFLSGKPVENTYMYINGGTSSKLFEVLGFKTDCLKPEKFLDTYLLQTIMRTPDFNGNYLMNASSLGERGKNIFPFHSYSISAEDTADGRKYIVRNPHNTANEVMMTEDELLDSFDKFYAAYINP